MNRDLFSAAGDLRPHLDAVDWDSTTLGPMDQWSPALRNAVDLMLHSKFPMTLLWGDEFVLLYNDAYVPMIGDKHPAALGSTARDTFAEAWPQIGPLMQGVATTGEATMVVDALVPLRRHGFLEDCYFTFCYSAVRGSDGQVEGVIDIVTETTTVVQGRRRVEMLARLSESLAGVVDPDRVRERALAVLSTYGDDFVSADIGQSRPDLPAAPKPLGETEVVVDELDDGERVAWAVTESTSGSEPSMLVVRLSSGVRVDDDLRDVIRVAASMVGRAIDRARAEQAERAHRELERQLSETLQRSLLSRPAQRDDLQVAVRYVPAASEAQVGGDWYDAFLLPDGDLAVVIGDITGHDREAAASMAQVRNVMRGVAMTARQSPARVLTSLEEALEGLEIDVLATAVVAHVDQGDERGARTLHWSNAGHPPPVMITPDGSAQLLHSKPDLLLGLMAPERCDHSAPVVEGSTVVLYTDGLIERRGHVLDDGFAWLEHLLAGRHDLDAEEVCDLLLEQMPSNVDDDVALLVLRVGAAPR
ncbi:PP2C family protein-serine/threonine phosphatase [Aeromicrobium stalagmiti]|uniref:PP2C family protein-serine/threonine phosphatase n=1 Tax=Aeromicrobium stalagmiti TaxID=2738988 RepID=UPI001569EF5D|nr:serine/threonine-protein phosphatase [Aeromicrobium stalagmiti]